MVLPILYWLLLILWVIGYLAPVPEPYGKYVRGVDLVLFIILGVKVFGFPT